MKMMALLFVVKQSFLPCFRGANELKNLYIPRVSEARETLVEDRTRGPR